MAQAFDIRTFSIDGNAWYPIVTSIACNYWSVRAAADCHVRTVSTDANTEDDLPAGAEDGVTAPPIVPATPLTQSSLPAIPRFPAGTAVVYIKSQVGPQVVVARFVLLLLLSLLARPLFAQRVNSSPVLTSQTATLSSSTCPGTGCITAATQGFGTIGIQVTGTWSGTLQFVGSIDTANFSAVNCTPPNSSTAVTTATANGIWTCSAAGLAQVRVGFNTPNGVYTSGSAVVTVQPAPAGGSGGGGGGAASSVTINDPTTPSQKAAVNASGQLSITCANCSGSGASAVDNSAFTAGTTSGAPAMGFYHSTIDTVTDGDTAAFAMDSKRSQFIVLRDAAQNARGANVTSANALVVDGSAVTQPVSGTVTTSPPSNASTNVAQFGGNAVVTGTGASGTGIPRVTLSNDSSLAANQSVNVNQIAGTGAVTAGVNGTLAIGGNQAATNNISANVNPVLIGGSDYGGTAKLQTMKVDSSGFLHVSLEGSNGISKVQGLVFPNTPLANSGFPFVIAGSDYASPTTNLQDLHVDPSGNAYVSCTNCNTALNAVNSTIVPAVPTRLVGSLNQTLGDAIPIKTVTMNADPCQDLTRAGSAPISQTANAQIIAGIPGRRVFVCHLMVVGADAENISLVEGSGTTCGSNTAAVIGGATAANGMNFAANGGVAEGVGSTWVAATATPGNSVCVFQSGSGRVAGVLKYAFQ